MSSVLCGFQSSQSSLHFGNYFGSLYPAAQMRCDKALFFVADLHTLTVPRSKEFLSHSTMSLCCLLLACLNKEKVNAPCVFIQSSLSRILCEIMFFLSSFSSYVLNNRIASLRSKDINGVISTAISFYPQLQVADLVAYKADYVVVGLDQKHHMEFARKNIDSFNKFYSVNILHIPQCCYGLKKNIMSLKNPLKKMSKSCSPSSCLFLLDDPDTLSKKILKAQTDLLPFPENMHDLQSRMFVYNLVRIYQCLTNKSLDDIIRVFGNKDLLYFKRALIEHAICFTSPIRELYSSYMNDKSYIASLMRDNAEQLSDIASSVLCDIKQVIGALFL